MLKINLFTFTVLIFWVKWPFLL